MKTHLLLPLLAASLMLVGCGQKNESAALVASAPVPAGASFELTANDSMKFNLARLEVTAGQDVTVSLTNMGNMPKVALHPDPP